jgi:hypothetical protein
MHLFTPVVEPAQWHPNFRRLWMQRNPWNECVIANWVHQFEDRDGKFAKEFQTTFNSCFWELYLFACFKDRGFTADFGVKCAGFRRLQRWGRRLC